MNTQVTQVVAAIGSTGLLICALPGIAFADKLLPAQIVVLHPAVPAPTYLDLGAPGDSVGDMRIWHFAGKTVSGEPVVIDWIMSTTSLNAKGPGIESRVSIGIFSFKGADGDQITLLGTGLYSQSANTFKDLVLDRGISGGSGKYSGIMGDVKSTHLSNGSWKHVFNLKSTSPMIIK